MKYYYNTLIGGESESKAKVDLILRILSKHPIEKLLSSLTEQYEVIEAMQEYTHDFVHTMYHATSVEEQQVLNYDIFKLQQFYRY